MDDGNRSRTTEKDKKTFSRNEKPHTMAFPPSWNKSKNAPSECRRNITHRSFRRNEHIGVFGEILNISRLCQQLICEIIPMVAASPQWIMR